MILENQVCSKKNSLRLKELGITQRSLFYYHPSFERPVFGTEWTTMHGKTYKKTQVCNDKASASAFTISELASMIRRGSKDSERLWDRMLSRINGGNSCISFYEPDFMAEFIIDLLDAYNKIDVAEGSI